MDYNELERRFREEVLSKPVEEMREFILTCDPTALGCFMTGQYLYEWDATKFYQKGHEVVFRGNTYISNCDNNTGAPEHMKSNKYWFYDETGLISDEWYYDYV